MAPLLPPWPLFAAFMAASLLLAITPGPGVIYIVTRSISHGRRHGIASVLGVAAGNLANALVAAFLPQFLAPQGNALAQGVLLGLCFVAMAAITDSLYAIAAGSLAPVLERARLRRLGQRAGGGALIGLGLFAALSGARIGR